MTALAVLNPAAQVALADCEQRIERGLKTFIDVGQALADIRNNRLYKGTHDTFESYLEGRWGMSRAHAYRMISAAEVVSPIGDTGLPTPTNEGQARALAAVPEPERAEVWRETVERTNGKPTAAVVKQVAEDRAAPDEQVQRRCFGCRHIFTSGADNTCPKCGGFGIRYQAPGPDGAVTAPPAGPGIEPPAEPVPPVSPAERAAHQDAIARESERRTAVASIRSVLTYLTSRVLSPEHVARQYAQALSEFTAADLAFAAKTMAALAALKEQ